MGCGIVDGVKASIVSGVDDHSRFVISARVVERATARPVCDALAWSMRTHGVPQEILTDNGKVFTGRFGPGTGEVLFDRICRENGIKHILTAPRSPTTTGKVERWHKTLRREFLNGRVFDSIADAQEQLDRWVHSYNHERRHQGIGDVVPWERFRLAKHRTGRAGPADRGADNDSAGRPRPARSASPPCRIRSGCGSTVRPSRCPSPTGSSASTTAGCSSPPTPSGTGRPRSSRRWPARCRPKRPRPRQATVGQSVTRKVDSSGNVSFAGDELPRRRAHIRRQVQVAIVGDTVEISAGGEVLKSIRSATTAPASTAPSPTPAADPHGSTPPNPHPTCNTATGANLCTGTGT